MADDKMLRAQRVFETMCQSLDARNWHYNRIEGELAIESGAQGDDLPMEIRVRVDADRQLITLLSHIPYVVPEDKRLDVAIAVGSVNSGIVDGSFDYNITNGHIFFRLTSSFIESEVGGELFTYMLNCSFSTIDEYNDKFLMLGKGMLSVKDFISNN